MEVQRWVGVVVHMHVRCTASGTANEQMLVLYAEVILYAFHSIC